MKRKLDDRDNPAVGLSAINISQQTSGFDKFGLDARILQAILREGYAQPTPVQAKAIPLALEGKDILGMFYIFIYPTFR